MIYRTINEYDFRQAFYAKGRENHFSYEALGALYDFYEELSEEVDIELDVIAICCEWCECTQKELIADYQQDDDDDLESILDYLNDNTFVIELDNSYLVQQF